MQYKILEPTLASRRGPYNLVALSTNPLIWEPKKLDFSKPRYKDVQEEILHAVMGKLAAHKYWKDEPLHFVLDYQNFYKDLFSLNWLNKPEDRHNIVASPTCCLTSVQYHAGTLYAYSRSTDMRNGYFSDRIILNYLAQHITELRPDCKVTSIQWFIAVPHVYQQTGGVARLIDKAVSL